MNTLTPKEDRMTFDKEVERVLKQMSTMAVDSEEYRRAVDNLKVLSDARGVKSPRELSMDIIVPAVANILGIILVLKFEQFDVITSKAIGMIFRGGRG